MYQVSLETFHGPLDLLLHLVKQHEVDVRDIPIARITDQFLDYIEVMQFLDVELAGEFIVMASTLMEIKSRLLLPDSEPQEEGNSDDGIDPRRELIRQLVEYRKFKDAAGGLEDLRNRHRMRVSRVPVAEPRSGPKTPPIRPVELWDLVSAFARLSREAASLAPTPIVIDETPQYVYEERIRDRLRREPRVAFSGLIDRPITRGKLIGLFLAMLELMRGREIWIEQPGDDGEIWLVHPPNN